MNAFWMEELEIKYLLITRISTYIIKHFCGSFDKPEEKSRQQWEGPVYK